MDLSCCLLTSMSPLSLPLRSPQHKAIRRDARINWIANPVHKHREARGLTAEGKKNRGTGKGHKHNHNYATWKRHNTYVLRVFCATSLGYLTLYFISIPLASPSDDTDKQLAITALHQHSAAISLLSLTQGFWSRCRFIVGGCSKKRGSSSWLSLIVGVVLVVMV